MTLADELSRVRYALAEPDSTGRFSDAELTSHINAARRDISLAVRFPEIRLTANTVGGQQEYALTEDILDVKRVYVAGQPVPRTDIATMEGAQIGLYDMTGTAFTPQWQSQAAAAYPVSADAGYPAPTAMPYYAGQRPMFYHRGGNIGLVPAPSGVVPMIVDGIALAPDLANPTDTDVFPRYYIDAICWKATEFALFADRDPQAYQYAVSQAERAMGALRDQMTQFKGSSGFKPLTYRSIFDPAGYSGGTRRPW